MTHADRDRSEPVWPPHARNAYQQPDEPDERATKYVRAIATYDWEVDPASAIASRVMAVADAEQAELRAKVARVEAALAVIDEVAYSQISTEKMLTILPTGPNRAQVPQHWQDEADERARPFRDHFRAALAGDA